MLAGEAEQLIEELPQPQDVFVLIVALEIGNHPVHACPHIFPCHLPRQHLMVECLNLLPVPRHGLAVRPLHYFAAFGQDELRFAVAERFPERHEPRLVRVKREAAPRRLCAKDGKHLAAVPVRRNDVVKIIHVVTALQSALGLQVVVHLRRISNHLRLARLYPKGHSDVSGNRSENGITELPQTFVEDEPSVPLVDVLMISAWEELLSVREDDTAIASILSEVPYQLLRQHLLAEMEAFSR